MKSNYFLLVFVFIQFSYGQEIEKATNSKNKTLALINAFVLNTYKGNTITDFSDSDIDTKKTGKYTLMLKVLKYKNFRENTQYLINQLKYKDSIIFNKQSRKFKDKSASTIIKNVIEKRKVHLNKTQYFSADYYTKNRYSIKNAPKKILSMELGDLGGGLDSTRSGIIYLSESISKIIKNKKQFKEHVLAVKVNGIDNKIGYNRASNSDFNFYKNNVVIGDKIVSPIAKTAFRYYKYKLEDTFKIDDFTIHKIKVIPKRKVANVFNGYIYIIADYWQIYAVDMYVKGKQIQNPNIDFIKIKQQYSFSKKEQLWLLNNQKTNFKFKQFNVVINGSIFVKFSNYVLLDKSLKINNKLFFISTNATNKKESFWINNRPIPLLKEEKLEYQLKKQIYKKRTSKKYLDSINLKQNKFQFSDVIFDYNHRNLYKKNRFKIIFPLNIQFNTIQGWNTTTSFTYFKDLKHQNYLFNTTINYGFSDKQLRATGVFQYRFNDKVNSTLKIDLGRQLTEFNYPYITNPITTTFGSLFLESNEAKYYDNTFAKINYHHEITNGLFFNTSLTFENRKPVFNTTNFTLAHWKDYKYTSNNPLRPNDFQSSVITNHHLYKINIAATFKFKQQYLLFPSRKVNLTTNYPKINVKYTKGFTFKNREHNFNYLETRVYQYFDVSNKGIFSYNFKAGTFFNKKNEMSFIDYKHFDVSQVHINIIKDYTNYFALLPMYNFSTNNNYAEIHLEHNFNGYLLRKTPLLNKLQNKLIIGANTLFTKEHKPYSELYLGLNNIGFGKYRFLRFDYVRSFIGNKSVDSFIFGLSL